MGILAEVFAAGPVIPVLAFQSEEEAVATSRTLYEAGMRVFEITLRHPTALAQIKAVIDDLPNDAMVGVGTVMNPSLAAAAFDTGAVFGVSPGLTDALADKVIDMKWGFLPGVATLSEAMSAVNRGFSNLKFFPAEASGGAAFLKAAGAVLADTNFCPTGGVTPDNAGDYLALSHVPVVGGSWIVKRGADGAVDHDATAKAALGALQTKS